MNTETEAAIRWRLRRAADYNDHVIDGCPTRATDAYTGGGCCL